jgi:hypothetical protein
LSDYEIGYGKPPKHSQFKKGVCPNPRGRGKREELKFDAIVSGVMNAKVDYYERGNRKIASRIELLIKKLVAEALSGNVASADQLLNIRQHAKHHGDTGPLVVTVVGGYHDIMAEEEVRGGLTNSDSEISGVSA